MTRSKIPAVTAWTDLLGRLEVDGWVQITTPEFMRGTVDDLFAVAEWFFAQPDADKLTIDIRESTGHRGYVPVSEQGDYADEGERRYEAFDIGREPAPGDAQHHPLRGPNRWPDNPDFGRAASDGFRAFEELAATIGHELALYLDLDPIEFDRLRTEPISQLRLLRYHAPQVVDLRTEPPSAMGAHTDYEFFTIICSREPGLEVLDRSGEWITTDAGLDRMTLIPGDVVEVLSGGRFTSTLHRTGGWIAEQRTSLSFFCGADFQAVVRSVTGGEQTELAFGEHLMRQLERDFPYLRDKAQNGRGSGDDALIDLTAAEPYLQMSEFEQRRLAASNQERDRPTA